MTSRSPFGRKKAEGAYSPKVMCQSWRLPPDATLAYTGYQFTCPSNNRVGSVRGNYEVGEHDDKDVLEVHLKKDIIVGYTGHLQDSKNICGKVVTAVVSGKATEHKIATGNNDFTTSFRTFAKNMDVHERYHEAVMELLHRGQSQAMLIKLVQAKFCERVSSYAQQKITTKLLFDAFDFNKDGVLDETEFRECLERLNIQLDDIQVTGLFAYFDDDNDGKIQANDFCETISVQNPKGGVAILPKAITMTMDKNEWKAFNKTYHHDINHA